MLNRERAVERFSMIGSAGEAALEPDFERLLQEQLQADLAEPWKISQRRKATCAATCVQILLALRDPARYLQLAAALAQGPVPRELLAGGYRRGYAGDDGSGRALTGQLMQPALMEYAKGASGLLSWSRGRRYDNERDRHDGVIGRVFRGWGRGLLQVETTHLLNGLFGAGCFVTRIVAVNPGYRLYPDEGKVLEREAVLKEVSTAILAGHPVPVGLRWHGELNGQHQVLLTRLDAEHAYLLNPWGELQSMTHAQFCLRLTTASLPTDVLTPLPGAGDALSRLPDAAGNQGAYRPLAWYRLQSVAEWLDADKKHFPALKGEARGVLARRCRRLHLAPVLLQRWSERLAGLSPDQAREQALRTLDALKRERSPVAARELLLRAIAAA